MLFGIYRVAHERPARRLADLGPRWPTRRRAGFSCANLYYGVNGIAGRASCEHIIDSSNQLTGIRPHDGPLAPYLYSCNTSFFYSHHFIQIIIFAIIKADDAFYSVPEGKLCFCIIDLVQIILACFFRGFWYCYF